jgi:hypothetical protein
LTFAITQSGFRSFADVESQIFAETDAVLSRQFHKKWLAARRESVANELATKTANVLQQSFKQQERAYLAALSSVQRQPHENQLSKHAFAASRNANKQSRYY